MVKNTKKRLIIYITLASISIVLFIMIGIYVSIYLINTSSDLNSLHDIISFHTGDKKPINKNDGPFDFLDGNGHDNSMRRPYFYFILNSGQISSFYMNMPMSYDDVSNYDNANEILETMGINSEEFFKKMYSKESGTINIDGTYLLFDSVETTLGQMYVFLDTTQTHNFFFNIIKMGVIILILSLFYIIFISKKILDRALDPLEMSIENQKRFTGDASHELRTPLTSMRSNLDILIEYDLTKEEQSVWLENISSEVTRMTRLTNDLLKLSRNEIIEKEMICFNLSDILDRVYLNYQNICNIDVEGGDFEVYAVKEDIHQLIIIFIDNGIKYNNKDQKNINIKATIDKNKKHFTLTIEDNGNGIENDKFDNIFERFYREDKARTSTQNGFGLGLSIAQNIINDYNGKVEIESEIGKGTKFKITFNILKKQN